MTTSFTSRGFVSVRTLIVIVAASSSVIIYGLFFNEFWFLLRLKKEIGFVTTNEEEDGLILSSIPKRNASERSKNITFDDHFVKVDDFHVVDDEDNKGIEDDYMRPLNISLANFYHCGYQSTTEAVLNIFPEFRGHEIEFSGELLPNVTSYDIVAIDGYVHCAGVDQGFEQKLVWFENNFQGTTIIINGESHDFRSWSRGFHLGYGPADNITSMKIFSCAILLTTLQEWDQQQQQQQILDPAKKQISMKERYLIYSNTHCVEYRDEAFDRLSQIDHAYHMGKCRGIQNQTISEEAIHGTERDRFRYNHEIFGSYRFCLVMENSNVEGYITEKILAAFLGGCIPIYYGTTDVFLLFNKKAFIYFDIENPQPALDRVTFLNQNNTAYDEVMLEPILANGNETIEEFFSLKDDIGGGKLKKRIRQMIYNRRRQYIE